uniref:RNA-dependent RNA polymerase n=1 Tax=Suillus luteus mitovirus 6 TaxID=3067815 RepID=A0AA50AH41_9VIRU|nr:RNA-dependent RNA polymerase [Suillus luteus mitovirus 6]
MKTNNFIILFRLIKVLFNINLYPLLQSLKLFFKGAIKNWGTIYTIKYWKRVRLHCTRYMCGQPLLSNNMSIGLDKEGWPKVLSKFKFLADSKSVKDKKVLLTILNFTRSWKLTKNEWDKIEPDYSSITDKPKGNYIIPSGFINQFVRSYKLKSNIPTFNIRDVFLSNKGSPNGPSTISAMKNITMHGYSLMQSIFNLTSKEGIDYYCKIYSYAMNNEFYKDIKIKSLGKLSFIKDPEGKLRIVAISDYMTQLYLRPIHRILMNLLKHFDSDRTYTQDPNAKWDFGNTDSFWSLDLSSATDRFPISLQKRLLTRIFDQKISNSWEFILKERGFLTPEGDSVQYGAGQPMGTYSSWAAFTLTHHLVVHWCAHLNGISNFNQYIILGDDIVIKNDKIAKTYIEVIGKLGVSISAQKTHVSKDTYEFAKRWMRPKDSVELTGLPLNGLINNIKNPQIVASILYDYFIIKRNPFFSKLSLSKLVVNIYFSLPYYSFNKKSKKVKKIFLTLNRRDRNRIWTFITSLNITFNYNYDTLRNLLGVKIKSDSYMLPNAKEALLEYKRILTRGAAEYIMDLNRSTLALPSKLIDKFEVEDKNELVNYPIFTSISNTMHNLKDSIMSFDKDHSTLYDLSKELCELNIDSIFNKERNKIQSLMIMNKIFIKGINVINKHQDELFYGSSWADNSFDLELYPIIRMSLNNKTISNIEKGKWSKPMSPEQILAMWSSL